MGVVEVVEGFRALKKRDSRAGRPHLKHREMQQRERRKLIDTLVVEVML